MQTILGANGVVARELSRHLGRHTDHIRQVSRHPRKQNDSDELRTADLLKADEVAAAVAGSDVTYLVAGLPYKTAVWQEQWPLVMRHVLDACKRHQSKLVFFDNVYAYGRVEGPMTEDTPYNPCSKKGEVRARIAQTMMDEVAKGELQGLIARAADFYGPGATLGMTHPLVTERLRAGKGPQWLGNPKAVHSFTYTPDAGRSVAWLGNTPTCFGQVWHVATSAEAISGEQFARLACEAVGKPYGGVSAMGPFLLALAGLFVPELGELKEMMYQFDRDYRFDSGKLLRAGGPAATPYAEGIAAMLREPMSH